MPEQNAPRLAPLPEAQWTDEMREMFAPTVKTFGRVFNIFTTLGRHPKLLKRWMVFANHCLLKSSLPPRERELVILRVGWQCNSEYEWAQHNRIGLEAGLSAEEIERCEQTTFDHLRRCGLTLSPDRAIRTSPADWAGLFPATGGAIYGPSARAWNATLKRPGSTTAIRVVASLHP